MRKPITLLIAMLLVFSLSTNVKAAPQVQEKPAVHAILFWENGCSLCSQTLTTILPTVQEKYQSQLSLLLIELASTQDVDNLYSLGAILGLTKEKINVPFLLIDHIALIGADDIKTKLSGLVESYLAAGGVEYPNVSLLSEMLPKGVNFATSDFYLQFVSSSAVKTNSTGMAMAWVIMILMGLALVFAIAMIWRAFQGKSLSPLKNWMDIAIPILAIIGLGASIYLTYVELTHTRALCGPVGDCNSVQSSPYAKLFGFLPVGLLGAFGYVAILATWLWRRLRQDTPTKIAGPAMFGMALFGTLFSIYLTYLELFVIHAVCIWCLSSAVIITALMLLSLPPITQWLAIPDEEE